MAVFIAGFAAILVFAPRSAAVAAVALVIVGGGIYLVRTATSGAARLGGLGLLVAGAAALASFAMRMALGV